MRLQQCVALAILVTGSLSPLAATGEVYVNGFYIVQPEPFSVDAGDSYTSVWVNGSSHIAINGGSVLNIDQEFAREPLYMEDDSRADILGGHLKVQYNSHLGPNVIEVSDNVTLNIAGGLFEAVGPSSNVLMMRTLANVNISGGTFRADGDHVLYMFGGFTGMQLNIRGGHFEALQPNDVDLLMLSGNGGIANIYGSSFSLDGLPIPAGPLVAVSGTLSVVYSNGQSEDITYANNGGTINLIEVPEPVSASLAMLALTTACLYGQRRQR